MDKMGKDIPYISEEMMDAVEKIFEHDHSRAKNHDLRLGQWLVNKIRTKYNTVTNDDVSRILFNLENQELWDILKGYND